MSTVDVQLCPCRCVWGFDVNWYAKLRTEAIAKIAIESYLGSVTYMSSVTTSLKPNLDTVVLKGCFLLAY